jgi:L-histidine N-alpha-methyltransferase
VTPARATRELRCDVHTEPADLERGLRSDVLEGLTSRPKELPPKWFYDERGSQLFDEITRLPEYYPTRREREILQREAPAIAARSGADTMIELGSGTSEKTRLLLDAMVAGGALRRFVPFDVDEATLRGALDALAEEYPGLELHGVCGDFDHHLGLLPDGGRRMVAFLGGTIGNFAPAERKRFLSDVAGGMEVGDSLLLGTDLVKDVDRLEAAYNDRAGVTAEFNRNILRVLNSRLDADFDPTCFQHVAFFDLDQEWIEMRLRARKTHEVVIPGCGDLRVAFEAGEEMRTEISAKFRRATVEAELAQVGLELVEWWTDAAGDFALSLSIAR